MICIGSTQRVRSTLYQNLQNFEGGRVSNSENQIKVPQEVGTPPLPPTSSTIGFDDVSTTMGVVEIPNGYRDLNWENVGVVQHSYYPGSGYEHGIVSGNYVASQYSGSSCSISSTTPFSIARF
mmetsp:Transcript_33692/g.71832  ORF Transcript_33692/g.71832 Transcript_33692/m.71832 type:complete len:123 (-) Transcript_33692:101-469(-)